MLVFERADFENWKQKQKPNLAGEVIWAEKHGNMNVEDVEPSSRSELWEFTELGIPSKRRAFKRKGLQAEVGG